MLTAQLIAKMEARFFQYPLEASVPAGGQAMPQVQIQNGFHFFSCFQTVIYSTISEGVDTGVCQLSAQYKAGGSQIGLSSDFIDLATIATPGRQRTVGVAGDPSLPMHIQGFPWPYLYEATSSIIIDLRSAAVTDANTAKFLFTGFQVPTYKVRTPEDFWNMLFEVDPSYGMFTKTA